MDYRKENCYKRKYSNGWGWSPQNTFTKPRHFQNDKNPRDYQNVKEPRYYQTNDKDLRPQSYRDRDDRPLLSEIDTEERERNRSTTSVENKPWLNYVGNVRNLNSRKNEKKFKKWNIGVEFNVTSDKHEKLYWQTKEQMDLYGMVRGHFYEEDCRNGEISKEKCSLFGQCGLPLRESSFRGRSMSRPRDPRSFSRPTTKKPRSRSVCFSEKITRIEYEYGSESDMNDFSQVNTEIDDTSRNDVFESENSDEQSSERKLIQENLKPGIVSVKSNSKELKYTDHIETVEFDEVKSMLLKSNEENSGYTIKKKLVKDSLQNVRNNKGAEKLVKDSVQDLRSNEAGDKLVKDSVQNVRNNEGGDQLVKDSVQEVRSNEAGDQLVKDSVQEVRSNEAGDQLVKDSVQEVRSNEAGDQLVKDSVQEVRSNEAGDQLVKDSVQNVKSFEGGDTLVKDSAQDVRNNEAGDKLVKDLVQDVTSEECVDNYPSNLSDNICQPTLDNHQTSKLALKDKMSNVKSNKKFHGFGNDLCMDLRQLELRTSIIKMQNQYEEDCQEFAQNSYDVIMESKLADINGTFYEYSLVDVHNAETIFDGKLSDSFQDYLIPTEEIFENDIVHIVNTDESCLRSQEEEFDAEPNVALSNLFKLNTNENSSEISRLVDNNLLSLPQESPLSSDKPTQTNPNLEIKAQLYQAQSDSRQSNPQQLVEDNKICQNAVQLTGVHSVSEDPTDNETSKPNEGALDSHVENQEIESDIDNNCLEKLNLNYLDKKPPTSLKMKIFKVEGNRFKVENIEDDVTEDTVPSQIDNPPCVSTPAPAITSKSSSESKESSRFSVADASNSSNASIQLRNCVLCSVCGNEFPRSLVDPDEMLEDACAWQCHGCALCILCFLREPGERLLACCKCGHRYHKTCARVDQIDQHTKLFVCKNCTL